MKVHVEEDLCIACGACMDTCPEVYDWNEDGTKAVAIVDDVPSENADSAKEALEGCPTDAIKEN